jgi:hypothetical protein
VGFLSRLEPTDTAQVAAFPEKLRPIQVDDTPAAISAMGRPALSTRVQLPSGTGLRLVCHLKSKLLTFPGGRFSTSDEGERARFAAYALYRRAAEATVLRTHATALLDGAAPASRPASSASAGTPEPRRPDRRPPPGIEVGRRCRRPPATPSTGLGQAQRR